jgi:hypothetical protein
MSVRVHVGGLEAPEYRVDRPWPDTASETAVDLLSPYGRMGFEVDPGEYEVEAFIDGRTVARFALTVTPGTELRMTAAEAGSFLSGGGMTCADPALTEAATTTTCLTTGATRDTGMEAVIVAADGETIDAFELGSPDLEPARALVRQMTGILGTVLFDPSDAAELEAWATAAEPGDTATVAGWRFTASGAGGRFTIRGERP